jgi:DME family drug/metabolite transporter
LANSLARNRLLLFLAAFLFSTGGAAIKLTSLTAWQVAGFRSGIAALTILALIPGSRRNWTWRTLAVGFSYAATLILFVIANKTTTAANAIFLQSTAPLYLLFLGPLMLREKTRPGDIAVFVAIAAGAGLLLYAGPRARIAGSGTGDLIAALSGFTWAWTIAGLRWLGKHDPAGDSATATVIAGNVIAFAICFPFAIRGQTGNLHHLKDVAVLLYLGVFQVALAYVFLTRSIRFVPAVEAAVLLLVEPVFNPFWTWLICAETPTPLAAIGGILIVTAAFVRTCCDTFRRSHAAGTA